MSTRYRQLEQAPASIVGGEAAIVTPRDSQLHILNGVGTRIWELCEGEGRGVEALVALLCEEFEVDEQKARVETKAFLESALRAGIIEEVS